MGAGHRARRNCDRGCGRDPHHDRRARPADRRASVDGGAGGRGGARADRRPRRDRTHQRLRHPDPPRRPRAAEGGGRQVTLAAAYFTISLVIGVIAAAVVVVLIVLLLQNLARIQRSVDGLLDVAGKVGANTANIPQLEATAPVLALIVEEAVVQDGYMNALTDGFDGA